MQAYSYTNSYTQKHSNTQTNTVANKYKLAAANRRIHPQTTTPRSTQRYRQTDNSKYRHKHYTDIQKYTQKHSDAVGSTQRDTKYTQRECFIPCSMTGNLLLQQKT